MEQRSTSPSTDRLQAPKHPFPTARSRLPVRTRTTVWPTPSLSLVRYSGVQQYLCFVWERGAPACSAVFSIFWTSSSLGFCVTSSLFSSFWSALPRLSLLSSLFVINTLLTPAACFVFIFFVDIVFSVVFLFNCLIFLLIVLSRLLFFVFV